MNPNSICYAMKFDHSIPVSQLATFLNCAVIGNPQLEVAGINEINRVRDRELIFVDHEKYYKKAVESNASVVIIDKEVDCPEGKALLISENPFVDFQKLCVKYGKVSTWTNNYKAHPEANIHPGCHIADDVIIGKGSTIYPGVVIYGNTSIGENVEIHANAVIGSDAFYFNKKEGRYVKMQSVGNVIIEDDVIIGASSTIDKGVADETVIGKGTRLDNLVHIGHDVVIGKNVLMAAHVGIAGCTNIEDDVTLWGQVGVNSKITIGKGATVFAKAGVMDSLEGGQTYVGQPAQTSRSFFKEKVILRRLAK